MRRQAQWILGGALVAAVTASTRPRVATLVSHEVIVVYVGVDGVDSAMAGVADSVRRAATRQIAGTGQHLILRGVSLDPEIGTGVRDLAMVGTFDEISVGGNWANSAVVHYLGGDFGRVYPRTGVPQVIVLEREVDNQITALHVGPEREMARYVGTTEIWNWARKGAPLSR
jgi:hypothetical protein